MLLDYRIQNCRGVCCSCNTTTRSNHSRNNSVQQITLPIVALPTQHCCTTNSTLLHYQLNIVALLIQHCCTKNSTLFHYQLNIVALPNQHCATYLNTGSAPQQHRSNIKAVLIQRNAKVGVEKKSNLQPCYVAMLLCCYVACCMFQVTMLLCCSE